jgi:uncharacterized membrane protein YjjB (DUF3815 family)
MKGFLAKVKKALIAGGVAGAGAVVTAWPDGISDKEWGVVAGAVVVGALATFGVKNAPWNPPAQ